MQNQNNLPDLGVGPASVQEPQRSTPSTPSAFTKFNDLPFEIQRRIFEIAYHSAENGQPGEWVYVSHKVREWIDPLIYESIILPEDFYSDVETNHRRLKRYEETFRSKPKEFYAKSVQRIFTNNNLEYGSSDFELELLQVCDNLVSLECWSFVREELTTTLKTKSWPKLKNLCINIDLLLGDENTFRLPIFKYVTHLDFTSEEPQLPSWESLKSLDNLTHMRVHMLVKARADQYWLAMDQVYTIATGARGCFPQNLKHFVILIPFDLLYYVFSRGHKAPENKQRWERMENLRLGTFDPRIMLGCSGSWGAWLNDGELDGEEEDGEEEHEESLLHYTEFVPILTYPICPRDRRDEEEKDIWTEVVIKDRERKSFLASRRK